MPFPSSSHSCLLFPFSHTRLPHSFVSSVSLWTVPLPIFFVILTSLSCFFLFLVKLSLFLLSLFTFLSLMSHSQALASFTSINIDHSNHFSVFVVSYPHYFLTAYLSYSFHLSDSVIAFLFSFTLWLNVRMSSQRCDYRNDKWWKTPNEDRRWLQRCTQNP